GLASVRRTRQSYSRPAGPLPRQAEAVEQALVLAPARRHLDLESEEHVAPEQVLDLEAGLAADALDHGAALADQDALLAVALDQDRGLDADRARDLVRRLLEALDQHRRGVRDLLAR